MLGSRYWRTCEWLIGAGSDSAAAFEVEKGEVPTGGKPEQRQVLGKRDLEKRDTRHVGLGSRRRFKGGAAAGNKS
jgi:hypothetical protein